MERPDPGRTGRRRRTLRQEAPEAGSFCPECLIVFKGDLDVHWYNDGDPRLSRNVCTSCYLALQERDRQEAIKARDKASTDMGENIAKQTVSRQVEAARAMLLATHVHEWEMVGPGPDNRMVFYCKRCPYDSPILKEVRPSND